MGLRNKLAKKKPRGSQRKRKLDNEDRIALLQKKAAKKHKKLEYAFNIQEARKRGDALKEAGTIHLDEISKALRMSSCSKIPVRSHKPHISSILSSLGVKTDVDDFAWSTGDEGGLQSDYSSDSEAIDGLSLGSYEDHSSLVGSSNSLDPHTHDDDDSHESGSEEDSFGESSSMNEYDDEESALQLHPRITLSGETEFTDESQGLLTRLMSGEDVAYASENFHEPKSARSFYTLVAAHSLSHMLFKSARVERNNKRLSKNPDTSEDVRDQGPNRPRLLWLAPFRPHAYEVVRNWLDLLSVDLESEAATGNLASFLEEYADQDLRNEHARNWESWRRELFKGHYDDPNYDDFVIGVSFNHGRIRIQFPKNAESLCKVDAIIASPLALSKIAAADRKSIRVREKFSPEPEEEQEDQLPIMDFLAGIEMLVVDRIDAMAMQNWENSRDVIQSVNQKAVATITADINRIEEKFLMAETAKAARQTIILSGSVILEDEYESLNLRNTGKRIQSSAFYSGRPLNQALKQKVKQQFFIKVPADTKLDYFKTSFWKEIGNEVKQLIIVVAISSDLSSLVEFLDDEGIPNSCCLSDETLSDIGGKRRKQIKSTLKAFREGEIRTIIVSERLLWYQRIRITGGRHVLFYGCPRTESVYSDILADVTDPLRCTSTCVYTPNESKAVERIVGSEKAPKLTDISVDKKITVFTP
jgi:hypothetical protein